MWKLTDRSGLPEPERAQLERELRSKTMLDEVLRWAFGASPPLELAEVVVQDEYSHDVVLTRPDRRALVFDCT